MSCAEGIFALFVTIRGMTKLRSRPDRSLTGLVRGVHWISSSSNPDLRDSRDRPDAAAVDACIADFALAKTRNVRA